MNKRNCWIKKIVHSWVILFLVFSFAGCSKENKSNDKNEKEEIIEMSVGKLSSIISDVEEAKEYENREIKVKGYYELYVDLATDTATKYIKDDPIDSNNVVQINDSGFLGDDYIGNEELELVGKISVSKDSVEFNVISAVVNGITVKKNAKKKIQTIEVTKLSDFISNKDYYQGTEVTLYGKISAEPNEENPNEYDYYLEDTKTKDKMQLNSECDKLSFDLLIKKDNPYVILNLAYIVDHNEGSVTYTDDSKNYGYNEVYISAIEKTDKIKIIEKEKDNKDYSTIVTPEELCKNFEKFEGKLISLEGYGSSANQYDGHHVSVGYILTDKDDMSDYDIRVFSKSRDKNNFYTDEIYGCFLESHKYLIKGTPKKSDEGYIYLEVDQN